LGDEVIMGIDDVSLDELIGLVRLRSLSLSHFVRMTDIGVAKLEALSQLEELAIAGSPEVTDQGLAFLSDLPHLQRLSLSEQYYLDGSFLAHLAETDGLRDLACDFPNWAPEARGYLRQLKGLEVLSASLDSSEIWRELPHLSVRELALIRGPETAEQWGLVAEMPDLRHLTIEDVQEGAVGAIIEYRHSFSQLETLEVWDPRWTPDQAQDVIEALPKAQVWISRVGWATCRRPGVALAKPGCPPS
jgi:hypothetical protein